MTLYMIVPVLNEYDNMERLFAAFTRAAVDIKSDDSLLLRICD